MGGDGFGSQAQGDGEEGMALRRHRRGDIKRMGFPV